MQAQQQLQQTTEVTGPFVLSPLRRLTFLYSTWLTCNTAEAEPTEKRKAAGGEIDSVPSV